MKYLKRNRRANVSFFSVTVALIAGLLGLVCFGLVSGEVALADNNTPASAVGKATTQPGGSAATGTVIPGGSSANKGAENCQLQPGVKPTGLAGNVNIRYDGDPATGLGYINNNGPCVWVVYLASYTVSNYETNEGQGLYDSASVTVYPGQRQTLQVKVPTQCRTQLDLVADKVVDLSNINYPIYHDSGRFIAAMQSGGLKLCASTNSGLLNGGTPTPTKAAPTATPAPATPTATVAPTSTPEPSPTTVAPTATSAPPTTIPATTAVPVTTTSTAAPVASTTAAATAVPTTAAPSGNPVTSAPVSTSATPATSAPAAVEGVEATRPPEASAPSAVDAASTNGPSANQAPAALAHAGEGGSVAQNQTSNADFGWWIALVFAGLAGGAYVALRLLRGQVWKR